MKTDEGYLGQGSPRRLITLTVSATFALYAATARADGWCEEARKACDAQAAKHPCPRSVRMESKAAEICAQDDSEGAVCSWRIKEEGKKLEAKKKGADAAKLKADANLDADAAKFAVDVGALKQRVEKLQTELVKINAEKPTDAENLEKDLTKLRSPVEQEAEAAKLRTEATKLSTGATKLRAAKLKAKVPAEATKLETDAAQFEKDAAELTTHATKLEMAATAANLQAQAAQATKDAEGLETEIRKQEAKEYVRRLKVQVADLAKDAGSLKAERADIKDEKSAKATKLDDEIAEINLEVTNLKGDISKGEAKVVEREKEVTTLEEDPTKNAKNLVAAVLTCTLVSARKRVCGVDGEPAEGACGADARLSAACKGVDSEGCRGIQARQPWCAALNLTKACVDFHDAEQACEQAEEACIQQSKGSGPRPDSWLLGPQVSEAAQLRVPRLQGLPSVFFSNLVGLGFSFQTQHIELMPMGHVIGSITNLEGPGAGQSQQATGVGVDGGLRVAAGWFDARTGGFYFSAYQAGSWLKLNATFSGNMPYSASMTEFSTDFGFGYKVRLGEHLRLDIFGSAVHIGVRPGTNSLVDITSYPTLGFGLDWLPWKSRRALEMHGAEALDRTAPPRPDTVWPAVFAERPVVWRIETVPQVWLDIREPRQSLV